jgi:hypothetical protein
MCDCHPMTKEEKEIWHRVRKEPNTKEDWEDLHNTIEEYKRRYIKRHTLSNRETRNG